mmetsp:Transcript_42551/g.78905  ORF Transcript_42551/g.78905 Transcript_42551/m.78905 type:complete len:130 (+) Transcript_42551:2-391(+)
MDVVRSVAGGKLKIFQDALVSLRKVLEAARAAGVDDETMKLARMQAMELRSVALQPPGSPGGHAQERESFHEQLQPGSPDASAPVATLWIPQTIQEQSDHSELQPGSASSLTSSSSSVEEDEEEEEEEE